MHDQRYIVVVTLYLIIGYGITSESPKSIHEDFREKRQINGLPLVYPYGGTYKLLIGFAAPVPNEDHINLLFSANFQYQYLQFQNISQLSQYYFINTVSREQRDADILSRREERIVFYKSVADLLEMKGMGGQDCVLRAICEAAQYPVHEEALVGEMLHILLTPDYGHSPFEEQDPDWEEAMSMYRDAATAGRQMFDCGYIYSGCPQGQGILDIITALRDE
ncbi:uncharacterized protein LOC120632749 isoform X2 [Pararge aegeria]|uniref:uncharacterized protein LOC120632749 isoform X2 n=1 Tax=Pararge aegeria TaxID=116150 RepID=UPI0019D226D0|nr:uncharacterized protein LOC120632749 isoform X2 [Pararge aegeria]